MSGVNRRAGKYSASDGFVLPAEGFTGTPDVECPDVGDDARAWWALWATSPYAHFFGPTEWQNLADTARIQHQFYATVETKYASEVRQRENNLFGLANRSRLHITQEAAAPDPAPSQKRQRREDPRLRSA